MFWEYTLAVIFHLVVASSHAQQEALLDEDTFSFLQVKVMHTGQFSDPQTDVSNIVKQLFAKIDSDMTQALAPNPLKSLPDQLKALPDQIKKIGKKLETNPEAACNVVLSLLNTYKEPGPPKGAFGSRLTQKVVLEEGIGEFAAQGLLKCLAQEDEEWKTSVIFVPPPAGATTCYSAITSMGVQYDPKRSDLLYEHSPHLWEAMVAWTRRVLRGHDRLREAVMMFAGLYGVPPSDEALHALDDAGGFDVMFDVLSNNYTDLVVSQAAWAGLSDNIENSKQGATLVANRGGANEGIEFLVNILKHYHGKHAYQPGMQFGLRYESIHDINGILFYDDERKSWLNAALGAGFLHEVIETMRDEPNDRLTQDNCCQALALIAANNATNQMYMVNAGAIQLMVRAVANMEYEIGQDDTGYRHVNTCSAGLLALAQGSVSFTSQKFMLQLDLDKALENVMPEWAKLPPLREPWGSRFPWSNVEKLNDILQESRAASKN